MWPKSLRGPLGHFGAAQNLVFSRISDRANVAWRKVWRGFHGENEVFDARGERFKVFAREK